MEVLQRLQPLDILFVVVWAANVGWGLQTGLLRQIWLLAGVYGSFVAAGTVYALAGRALSLAFGTSDQRIYDFIGYVGVFAIVFGVIVLVLWSAYPVSRLKHGFGLDSLLGAVVAAVWGVLLLIALVTVLRFYVTVPWRGQEAAQQSIRTQVTQSEVAPVLQLVTTPLWQAMLPWFPAPVSAQT